MELVEVQFGDYLGEDDIVRLQDNYGRNCGRASMLLVRFAQSRLFLSRPGSDWIFD